MTSSTLNKYFIKPIAAIMLSYYQHERPLIGNNMDDVEEEFDKFGNINLLVNMLEGLWYIKRLPHQTGYNNKIDFVLKMYENDGVCNSCIVLYRACKSNHYRIIKVFLEKMRNDPYNADAQTTINQWCFNGAYDGGNIEIAKLCVNADYIEQMCKDIKKYPSPNALNHPDV